MDPLSHLRRAAGLDPQQPLTHLGGGDVAQVWRCGEAVIKTLRGAPSDFFRAEARGLALLHEAGALAPEVLFVDEHGIVLQYLAPSAPRFDALAVLLCGLHQPVAEPYGSDHPLYLGRLPLPAGTSTDWTQHFVERRLTPLIAQSHPHLSPALRRQLDRYLANLVLPTEGPCVVHGDLWSGNLLHTADGPALIDPSAQIGERGLDLAMMKLFGGFPESVFDGIARRRPISPEVNAAIGPRGAYQLYFLLAHVAMFGPGWLGGVRQIVDRRG
ncbi:MAG: fructosamine kinase [Deltaproteobacteria bacterium]|nr:MAG: fructosamine kinase [Deltaproteobacteria bacterium]